MQHPPAEESAGDARLASLSAWLADVAPAPVAMIAPASGDASFRRYFRVTLAASVAVPGQAERRSGHTSTLIPVALLLRLSQPPGRIVTRRPTS